jgi:hypothetical protein
MSYRAVCMCGDRIRSDKRDDVSTWIDEHRVKCVAAAWKGLSVVADK